MKQKKEPWFIKNRFWIFYIVLFILIIVTNFVYDRGKRLVVYGFEWLPLIGFLVLVILFILLLGVLFFFVYYDDSANQKIKKHIKWFDWIIHKISDKEN